MKMGPILKTILFTSLFGLYGSGAIVWVLQRYFRIDRGFGSEPPASALPTLHIHSVISLWFIGFFGYLVHSHMLRGYKAKKKLRSGLLLSGWLFLLILTVPGLFYLNDEGWKTNVALFHTYAGLALALPFAIHLFTKVPRRHHR